MPPDSAHWHIHCSTTRCRFRIATCPPSTRNLLTAPSSLGVHCVARPVSRCTCGHSLACEAHSRLLERAGAACACWRTRWGALKSAQSSKSKDFCSSRDEQNGQPSTTSGPGADVAGVSPVPVKTWSAERRAEMLEMRAQSWGRYGRREPSPGADVAGVSPAPVQMWSGERSAARCSAAQRRRNRWAHRSALPREGVARDFGDCGMARDAHGVLDERATHGGCVLKGHGCSVGGY